MSDVLKLKADSSRTLGTRPSRRLRREGKVPGVIYGMDKAPESVAVVYGELRTAMTTDAGLNALLDLDIDGTVTKCIVKDLQRHPVRDEVIHVDFVRIDENAEISVEVPIVLVGEARKVTQVSGMVDQVLFSLTVNSKPGDIPNELEANIEELEVGDSVRVADINLPAGVSTDIDLEEAVAVGVVTRSTLEAMAAEEAADGEGGEEAAASAPAEDAGDDGDGDEG